MLSKKLKEALNEQINGELWSAYLYLSMSMNAEAKGHKGIANWFYVQFKEEQDHARIIMNFLFSVNEDVKLLPLAEVPTSWNTTLDMYKASLEQEKKVTASIHNLAKIAKDEENFEAANMLQWFVDEQIEEEENDRDMIQAFENVENDAFGLYSLDKELGKRKYSLASPLRKKEDD